MSRFVELGEGDNLDIELSEIQAVVFPVESEEVTIEPTTEEQVILPTSDKKLIGKATVKAVTSEIDANIKPENIVLGKTILGVEGNAAPDKPDQTKTTIPTKERQVVRADVGFELAENIVEPIPDEYNNTSDATAEAYDIARGKTAYTRNGLVEGTLVDRLQLKCDQTGSLQYEFYNYGGSSVSDILNGLDFSGVRNLSNMCYGCRNLEEFPRIVVPNATTLDGMFRFSSSASGKLTTLDLSGISGMGSAGSLTYGRGGLQRIILPLGFKPTTTNYMFNNTDDLTELVGIDEWDLTEVTNATQMFYGCGSLTQEITLNIPNCTTMDNIFAECQTITVARLLNSGNATATRNLFQRCYKLVTAEADLRSSTNVTDIVSSCRELVNLTLKNIRISIRIGGGSGISVWGTKLSQASIINTAKELWDLTGSTSQTLTYSSSKDSVWDSVYVKLITATDEMIAQDPYINNKKPCEVCESTDEGAMTLREYAVSKNWALARG